MKTGTIRHPKVYLLARYLKIRPAEAVGILQALWEFTMTTRPDGNLAGLAPHYLAESGMWCGTGQKLLNGLVKAKLVDRVSKDLLYVHDWHEHCEYFVHNKLARSGTRFANGSLPSLRRLLRSERASVVNLFKMSESEFPGYTPQTDANPLLPFEPRTNTSVPVHAPAVPLPLPLPVPDTRTVDERLASPSGGGEEDQFVARLGSLLNARKAPQGGRQGAVNEAVARQAYKALQVGELGIPGVVTPQLWERVTDIGLTANRPWGAFTWYLKQLRLHTARGVKCATIQ